jgi:hypothetical protein
MESHDATPATSLESPPASHPTTGRRIAWHALALVLAALVAWFIFAAYRQPELMLDLAGMRLC